MVSHGQPQDKQRKRIAFVFCAAAIFAVTAVVGYRLLVVKDVSLDEIISNNDEVIAAVRQGLRDHSRQITITFSSATDVSSELSRFAKEWMDTAMEETADPVEGDYIRYQCGGYQYSSGNTYSNGRYAYTVKIVPDYYMYLVQEEAVAAKLADVFDSFHFDGDTSDYNKVKTIYQYICSRVSYDKVHQKNPYYCLRSTAYAALIQETATCQGYCVALYRMLRMAGINTRVITGTAYVDGSGSFHAWNIAELDGMYYCLDATWDAGEDVYSHFLVGTDNFLDHEPDQEFSTKEFAECYPISKEDYSF